MGRRALYVSAGTTGGGGGGSVDSVSGDGTTIDVSPTTGATVVSAILGTGAGTIQEATSTAIGVTLGGDLGDGVVKLSGTTLTAAAIVNADVDAAAAIAGSKVSPNFGAQNVATTGTGSFGSTTVTALSIGSLSGVLKASTGTVSAATIVNADVDAAAAIAVSKLAFSTANYVVKTNNAGDAVEQGLLVNANIDAAAAIAGTKVSPDFGSQNVVTTGTAATGALTVNNTTANSVAVIAQTNSTTRVELGNDATGPYVGIGGSNLSTDAYLRLPRTVSALAWRNQAQNANIVALATDSSNLVYVGATSAYGSSNAGLRLISNATTIISVGTSTILSCGSTGTLAIGEGMSAPSLQQTTKASNNPTNNLTISAQAPNASATGANRVPGSIILSTAAATNSGTTQGTISLRAKATDVMVIGHDDTQGTLSLPTIEVAASAGASQGYIVLTVNGTRRKIEYYADA